MEYKVSKSVFFKEAILKVAYLWQEDFSIKITEDENNYMKNGKIILFFWLGPYQDLKVYF